MPAKLSSERRQRIIKLYAEGNPACAIAKWLSHDRGTILQILHEENIPIRPGAKNRILTPEQERDLAQDYEIGLGIDDLLERYPIKKTAIYKVLREQGVKARKQRTGPESSHWTGGKHTTPEGYINIWVEDDSPFAKMRVAGTCYAREHRIVMAEYLGRCLTSKETVHHINGDRADNEIGNLQLRGGHHGAGQILRCRECGSLDIEATEL